MPPTLVILALAVFLAIVIPVWLSSRRPTKRRGRWATHEDEAWWVREKSDEDRYDPPSISSP